MLNACAKEMRAQNAFAIVCTHTCANVCANARVQVRARLCVQVGANMSFQMRAKLCAQLRALMRAQGSMRNARTHVRFLLSIMRFVCDQMVLSQVMADFGQNRLWPKPTLAKPSLAKSSLTLCVWCVVCLFVWVGAGFTVLGVGFRVWVLVSTFWFGRVRCPLTALPTDRPSPGPPFPRTALPPDRPSPGPPKISLFVFPLPPQNSFFSLLSVGLLVEFWWCFRRPGSSNVHVWAFWLSCETPAAFGPPGLHMTTRELQTRTLELPGDSNTTKIPREDPQREEKRTNYEAGEGKNAKFWAPTLRASHPLGPYFFCFWAPGPLAYTPR